MSDLIKFEETVSYLLAKVTTAFRNSLERHMGRVDLHGGQIFILFELWKQDGLRLIDLVERVNVAAPTVTKMVDGLMEIRLVTRTKIEGDNRSKRIFLTESGRAMRGRIEAQWLELEESCLTGLTETERLVLFDLLGKLRSSYTGSPGPDED